MSRQLITASLWGAVFFVLGGVAQSMAQAVVRDSSPTSAATPVVQVSAPTNQAYQIQQLQQEVLELRGLLEEQGFEIKRLKQQRLDDYLDIDKRLRELSGKQASSSSTAGAQQDNGEAASTSDAEKDLYTKAIDLLLSQQDYKGAKTNFEQYLTTYPQGVYAPNVYYWQAQILLTESNKQGAVDTFTTLIETYPEHQKVPDAKYKLATVYFDLGKKTEAKTLLDSLAASDTDAARLAKAFLAKHYK